MPPPDASDMPLASVRGSAHMRYSRRGEILNSYRTLRPARGCLCQRVIMRTDRERSLRGTALRRYGQTEVMAIEDITDAVIAQRAHLHGDFAGLRMPGESRYDPTASTAAQHVGLDAIA